MKRVMNQITGYMVGGGVSPTEKAGNVRIKVVRKYDKESGEKDNSIRRVGSK